MGLLNLFGGDKQETTYNTTQQWYDSYNTTLSSVRNLENVGNTAINIPTPGALGGAGSTSDYVVLAIVGVLVLAALALVFRSG
jgi:hypothetical protein